MDLPSAEKVGPYSRRGSDASSLVRRLGAPTVWEPEISWSQTRPNASNVIQRPSGDWFGQRRIFALIGPASTFSSHATRGAAHCSTSAVNGMSESAPDATSSRESLPLLENTMDLPSGV